MRATPLLLGSIVLFAACGDSPGAPQVTLSSIEIQPSQTTLQPDASVDLTAQGRYSDGSSKPLTDSVAWSSGSTAAVTVSDAAGTKGRATWAGGGSAVITASYLGKSGTTTVTALGISSINVGPVNPSLDAGNTLQMTAQAALSNNGGLDVTTTATWSSSNTSVATVSNDAGTRGRVTAVGGGTATISATFKGVTGQTTATSVSVTSVTVMGASGPPIPFFIGDTHQLSAIATLSNGSQRTVTDSATWASSTSAVTVSNAGGSRGLVSRSGEDSSVVSATYRGVTGTLFHRKACVALATGLSFDALQGGMGVGLLRVDGGTVVWYDYDPLIAATGGAFRSVPVTGGTVTTIRSGLPFIGQWTMDATYAYWIFVFTQSDQSWRVVRMNRSSGVIDTLHKSIGLGGGSRGIAVDASSIYYTPGNAPGVTKMPKTGGAGTAYHAGSGFAPRWITLDAATGTVYGVDGDASPLVRKAPTNGAKMDTLGAARASWNSALAGDMFYWTENAPPSSAIKRVSTSGGTPSAVVSSSVLEAFVIDGNYVYFGQHPASSSSTPPFGLYRQALSGGNPELVTDACGNSKNEQMKMSYLATDGTYIYFTDLSGANNRQGKILRVKK